MVVRLRLQRWGRKGLPVFRIVAADIRAPRDGRFLEKLGTYRPIPTKDGVKELQVNVDRVKYWLSVGAQPSDRVKWLFGKLNILPPPPYRVRTKSALPKKTDEASV